MLTKILDFLFRKKTNLFTKSRVIRTVESDETNRPSEGDFALTYKPGRPLVVMLMTPAAIKGVHDSEGTEDEVTQTRMEAIAMAQTLVYKTVHRETRDQQISVRHAFNISVTFDEWKFFISMIILGDQSDYIHRDMAVYVDPFCQTEVSRLVKNSIKLSEIDLGSGSLEETMLSYLDKLHRDCKSASVRLVYRDPSIPKPIVGWFMRDKRNEGLLNKFIKDLFKPRLSIVE